MKIKLNGWPVRLLILLLMLAVLAGALWLALSQRQAEQAEYGVELLKNGSFEELDEAGLPADWLREAYVGYSDVTSFEADEGMDGHGVRIANHSPNDARFMQTVKVAPNTQYRFSGYIRARAEGGRGANLSVADIYVFSEAIYDTRGEWQQVEIYGQTGSRQHEVTLFARLGGYSGEASGEAGFDRLSLVAVENAPDGAWVDSWDKPVQPARESADSAPSSFAPQFVLICLVFLLLMYFLALAAASTEKQALQQEDSARAWIFMAFLLVFALISRLWLASLIPGFPVDIDAFRAWSHNMADAGPAGFYLMEGHRDYPPGYMLVLWPLGLIGQGLEGGVSALMVKLPSILSDLAVIMLLFIVACRYTNKMSAALLSALYAFNPLTYLAGAAWGQVDSLPSLLLLLSVLFILKRRWRWALPVYTLAVLMKPQALMVGPLGLLALICDFVWRRKDKPLKDMLTGALASLLVIAAVALPFFNRVNGLGWLLSLYGNTMSFYNYATVNAANLYFLFGQNWVRITEASPLLLRLAGSLTLLIPIGLVYARKLRQRPLRLDAHAKRDLGFHALAAVLALLALLPQSLGTTGVLLMLSVFVSVTHMFIKGRDTALLPLLAGILLAGFSILGTMMHERYLFLSVALLTLAYILRRDRRVLYLLLALSALCFLNTGVTLDRALRIEGGAANLDAPLAGLGSDSAWLEYTLAFLSLPIAAFAMWLGHALIRKDAALLPLRMPLQGAQKNQPDRFAFVKKREQVRFDRRDALIILIVTLLYAVVALVNLGSTVAPQTEWVSAQEQAPVTLDLGEERDFKLLLYGGIHWSDADFQVEVSPDGADFTAYPFQFNYANLYTWRYLSFPYQDENGKTQYNNQPRLLAGRYVRLSGFTARLNLLEVIAQDSVTGENLPFVSASPGAEALIDEQHTLKGPPDWYNSMYFDEIYHARTALEQRNALLGLEPNRIYETTHPPLGKLFMTFSIMAFGMTPFGWRFAGAMAGVMMLPGLYLLGKQLTRKRLLGLFAMLMMAFDFMHFAQTRIATIDSFVTLFIIYAYFFMFRYMMQDALRTPLKKRLLLLFLSGLMMGLAIASKWPGIYAGLGLAVLFFWSLGTDTVRGWRLRQAADGGLDALGEDAGVAKDYAGRFAREIVLTMLWCLLFFVTVPALTYYLSYIPVYIATPGGLTVQKVVDANISMFNYHAKPGFGADHRFSSPWYSWPVIGKPLYFYSGGVRDGTSSVIWTFGSPLVWWGGLAALALTALSAAAQWLQKRRLAAASLEEPGDASIGRRAVMLLIAFLAQYLPWALVPRGTYIYHYFPAVPFIILCMALLLDRLYARHEKAAKITVIALCALGAMLFIAYFPYISGVRVSVAWLEALRIRPDWLYY